MPPDAYHLVLTACVAPRVENPLVSRYKADERLADYLGAFRHALAFDDARCAGVLLLENSGHPLDAFREIATRENRHGRAIDIRSAGDNEIPEGISYGYAELGMLDAAADESTLWNSATMLVKVTGRLTFPGLPRLIARLDSGDRFVADARNPNRPGRRSGENGSLTTQVLLFTPAFYREHLYGVRRQMRPEPGHRLIESTLYRTVWPLRDQPGVRLRFPVNCSPRGEAAHWQKSYQSPREQLKNAARAVGRIVAPQLWF